jgi:16S rRNA processing protein RimM
LRWRGAGIAEIAELIDGNEAKVADRTAAERLINVRLYVDRAQLPEPEEDEFYLADLIGLAAFDASGAQLGRITAVHDYGAGASLEIAGEMSAIVPFTRACVPEVNVDAGRVTVALPEDVHA